MKKFLDFSTTKKQDPDIVFVKLHPENDQERRLLDENTDSETIESYYHAAVNEKLPGYALLKVVNASLWPYAADLMVKKIVGMG